MVEISDLQVRAELDGARIRLDLAEQELDQRALADAVVTDQAEAVAAHELEVEVADDRAFVKGLAEVRRFADDLAALLACVDLEVDAAHAVAAGGTLSAEFFEASHAALIAGAAGFDALADPDFLLSPELVEAAVGQLFGLKLFLLAAFVFGKLAGIGAEDASVKLDDAARDVVEELTVVSDDDKRALGAEFRVDEVFERRDGDDVQMVRRLVEKQKIWLEGKGERQSRTLALAAAHAGDRALGIELELHQALVQLGQTTPVLALILDLVKLPAQDEAFLDIGCLRQDGLLLDVQHAQAVLHAQFAVVEMRVARKDGEQGALARAVAADQTDTFAGFDGEVRIVKKRKVAPSGVGVHQGDKRHFPFVLFKYCCSASCRLPEALRARWVQALPC